MGDRSRDGLDASVARDVVASFPPDVEARARRRTARATYAFVRQPPTPGEPAAPGASVVTYHGPDGSLRGSTLTLVSVACHVCGAPINHESHHNRDAVRVCGGADCFAEEN